VVGFASPRVGNSSFNQLCRQCIGGISWMANGKDIIPRLPPMSGFEHVVLPQVLQGTEVPPSTSILGRLRSVSLLLGAVRAIVTFQLDDIIIERHSVLTYWNFLFDQVVARSLTGTLVPSTSQGTTAGGPLVSAADSEQQKTIRSMIHVISGCAGALSTRNGLTCVLGDVEMLESLRIRPRSMESLRIRSRSLQLGQVQNEFEESKVRIHSRISALKQGLDDATASLRQASEDSETWSPDIDMEGFLSLAKAVEALDSFEDLQRQRRLRNSESDFIACLATLKSEFDECLTTLNLLQGHVVAAATSDSLQAALVAFLSACSCVTDAHKEVVGKLTLLAEKSSVRAVREVAGQELYHSSSRQRQVHDALLGYIGCLSWYREAFAAETEGIDQALQLSSGMHFCSALLDPDSAIAAALPAELYASYAQEPQSTSVILALAEMDVQKGQPLASSRACRAVLSVLSSEPEEALRLLNLLPEEHLVAEASGVLWLQLVPLFVLRPALREDIVRVVHSRREELASLPQQAGGLLLSILGSDAGQLGERIAAAREAQEGSRRFARIFSAAEGRLSELVSAALQRGDVEEIGKALAGARASGLRGSIVDEAASFHKEQVGTMASICTFCTSFGSPVEN